MGTGLKKKVEHRRNHRKSTSPEAKSRFTAKGGKKGVGADLTGRSGHRGHRTKKSNLNGEDSKKRNARNIYSGT